jgi:hypothetical protein
MFREDDGRVSCFAVFDIDPPDAEQESSQVSQSQYVGDVNPSSNPIV